MNAGSEEIGLRLIIIEVLPLIKIILMSESSMPRDFEDHLAPDPFEGCYILHCSLFSMYRLKCSLSRMRN